MWEYNYNSLQHYASPYYDPQKAHEYYEQHKKLKGRRTTTTLTDEGKEAASYVKSQITDEKNAKLEPSSLLVIVSPSSSKAARQRESR